MAGGPSTPDGVQGRRSPVYWFVGLTILALLAAFLLPAVKQPLVYHNFADRQDVPLAAPVRELCESTGTPLAILHELDETRPVAALRLRLETFAHAMRAPGLGPTPLVLP